MTSRTTTGYGTLLFSMRYVMTMPAGTREFSLEVSKADYEGTAAAKKNLIHALAIEEKFHFFLENYREFVEGLLVSALHHSIFSEHAWSEAMGHLNFANRRLLNLLTTAKLYLDQVCHDLSSIYGNTSHHVRSFRLLMNQEYEKHFAYRFLDALRNYSQHRGLPIHGGGYARELHESRELADWIVSMELTVNSRELKGDGKFKASVLAELEQLGADVSIKPFVREYVCCLGRMHEKVRETMASDVAAWTSAIQGMRQRFRSKHAREELIGLYMSLQDDKGKQVDEVDMFDAYIGRREMLVKRCQHPGRSSGFVIASDKVPRV